MSTRYAAALCLFGALAYCPEARAQPTPSACGPRTEILKALENRYREQPVAAALTSANTLLEVLASSTGSTWTIIVTQPGGITCIVAAGVFWQKVEDGRPI